MKLIKGVKMKYIIIDGNDHYELKNDEELKTFLTNGDFEKDAVIYKVSKEGKIVPKKGAKVRWED